MVAINPRGVAVFPVCPYDDGVAVYGHGRAKQIRRLCVRRFEVRLLAPHPARAGENIGRPSDTGRIIRLVAIDPRGVAIFADGSHDDGVAVYGHGGAIQVIPPCVRRFEVVAGEEGLDGGPIGRAQAIGGAGLPRQRHGGLCWRNSQSQGQP